MRYHGAADYAIAGPAPCFACHRKRRAQILGEIAALEARARFLRLSLGYLDGTLAIMAPGFDPATIKLKSQHKAKLFRAGKLNAMILDALRRGDWPMRTAEVTSAVAKAMGFGPEAEAGLKSRVRSKLLYLAKVRGSVVKEGEREGAVWRLTS